jgi:hypothetical protein
MADQRERSERTNLLRQALIFHAGALCQLVRINEHSRRSMTR